MQVHIDFETQSLVSVKDTGAWVYSKHPSTSILCARFAVGEGEVKLITNRHLRDYCFDEHKALNLLSEMSDDPEVIFTAHNAAFEQCIWQNIMVERYGYAPIPIERWRCTAAKAAAMSLPRDLKGVAEALNLTTKKDDEGHKVMMKLSRPRRGKFGGELVFWTPEDCPDDFEKLYSYCKTDVEVERLVDKALPDLSQREQKIWFLDQKINFKGVQLDVAAINQTTRFIEKTVADLTTEFKEIVNHEFDSPSQVVKFREWLKENGCDLPDLQATTVDQRLQGGWLDHEHVYRALEIRRALSKISTSKYTSMLDRRDSSDDRLRDTLLYAAAITKRWGGRGVQLHNLPRGTVNSNTAIAYIMEGDYEWLADSYPNLMAVYSSCIRGMITASPGCELFVGDFSAIEAMVLPWLAGQTEILDIFREGKDIYCEEAAATFGRPINKKDDPYERGVGKVEVLALGFNGGIGAFGTMARSTGVDLIPAYNIIWPNANEDEKQKARSSYNRYLSEAEKAGTDYLDRSSGYAADVIKQRWRRKNSKITQYWSDLESAAVNAVLTGEKQTVHPENGPSITYGMYGEHLLCQLPSGNCIVYPFAKVSQKETKWGEKKATLSYSSQDSVTYQFKRTWTYGGKLAENITQAVARDLLADALIRLDEAGYPLVLHVHDEVVADVPKDTFEHDIETFKNIMAQVPPWATGIPIKVECWKGERYKK